MRLWFSFVLAASYCCAQVESEWDVRKLLEALTSQVKRVKPILDQADPKNWPDAAAAQNYAGQYKSAQNEIQYLTTTTDAFGKQPERLTLALDTFFRLESMEKTLGSFADGLRKHGNPAVGELLEGTLRENSGNRERLRDYISELARNKEQEFRIADQEAQRCRAAVAKQPPPPPASKKK